MTRHDPTSVGAASKPTVFVANADGFVESHLVATLLDRGFRVRASRSAYLFKDASGCGMGHPGAQQSVEYVAGGHHLASEWKSALGNSTYAVQVCERVTRALPSAHEPTQQAQCEMEALRQAARSKGVKCVDIVPAWLHRTGEKQAAHPSSAAARWPTSLRDALGPIDARPCLRMRIHCPMGPLQGAKVPGSMEVLKRLLEGTVRRIPRVGYEIVDVRDVSAWLVDQLERPDFTGGDRTLRGTFIWMADMAEKLRRRFPQFADGIPEAQASDVYVFSKAFFNPDARKLLGALGQQTNAETLAQDCRDSDFQTRPFAETLIDAARSVALLSRAQVPAFNRAPVWQAEG